MSVPLKICLISLIICAFLFGLTELLIKSMTEAEIATYIEKNRFPNYILVLGFLWFISVLETIISVIVLIWTW